VGFFLVVDPADDVTLFLSFFCCLFIKTLVGYDWALVYEEDGILFFLFSFGCRLFCWVVYYFVCNASFVMLV
jgi:hypothetical protein